LFFFLLGKVNQLSLFFFFFSPDCAWSFSSGVGSAFSASGGAKGLSKGEVT
jgi:hypothetical protein